MAVDKDPPPLSLYNYVLSNIQRHKLRYGLTIFGLIICIVFFIIVASLSIGLYEPTEPEITPDENTTEGLDVGLRFAAGLEMEISNKLLFTPGILFDLGLTDTSKDVPMSPVPSSKDTFWKLSAFAGVIYQLF